MMRPKEDRLSVLALTRYARNGASSRVRVLQFIEPLRSRGVDVHAAPLLDESYLNDLYGGRRTNYQKVVAGYVRRLLRLAEARRFDVVWVQKELFPFLPALVERRLLARFVYDIDDAWHLRYAGSANRFARALASKVPETMRAARVVFAGNRHLQALAAASGATDARHVPSVVPVHEYTRSDSPPSKVLRVGWVGSPSTVKYLDALRPAFETLGRVRPLKLVVVGASFERGEHFCTEELPWSEAIEKRLATRFDVGVMPLSDDEWTKGKCAYKAIQYMASGLPVVASNVGANRDVIADGVSGRLVGDATEQWTQALQELAVEETRRRFGDAGRERAERRYSVNAVVEKVAQGLRDAADTGAA
ncbi:MAG: glycosyltransferase family 4 protein [Myxococcota bacterium]